MSLSVDITAPNGRKYNQPTGLFINNEFVPSSGQTIVSLDPAYVYNKNSCLYTDRLTNQDRLADCNGTRRRRRRCRPSRERSKDSPVGPILEASASDGSRKANGSTGGFD